MIVDCLIKMVYYKLIKITIDALRLVKVIINMIIRYYRVSKSIIIDLSLLFISKFWFLLYYFLEIKKKLFTVFYPQMDGKTKRQNNIIEAYIKAFVN